MSNPRPIAVWAPVARQVDLALVAGGRGTFENATRIPLTRVAGDAAGWWHHAGGLAAGTDYGFSLDGGPPRPDPVSAHQPFGVHGPSRVFDPAFSWSDDGWQGCDLRGRVIYECHIGTFTAQGTLDAAIRKLDHLTDLGVQMVELLPVAAFDGRWGWGYDGVDLYAVHEPYGGPRALQRFVDAAHSKGLGVILDVVYNHLGPSGNYLAEFGPYFIEAHHTPWGPAVNLDGEHSAQVREWIIANALRWFTDFHIDALRLDAVHELHDDSPTHLLAQLADRVGLLGETLGRPLGLIAESDRNDPATITAVSRGGLGMTAQWADDVHHAIHALLTGERQGYYVDFGTVDTLRKALTRVFVHDGGYSTFRGQQWGRPVPPGTDPRSFVVFDQDHDQVGNRAMGDRTSASLPHGLLAASAAIVLLAPMTPMLFMGEEWAATTPWQYFSDFQDPELAQAVRDGRRAEFSQHGWSAEQIPDPQDPATRERSVLDWAEASAGDHRLIVQWYRRMIAIRKAHPVPSLEDVEVDRLRSDPTSDCVTVRYGELVIVVNQGDQEIVLPHDPDSRVLAAWESTTTSEEPVRIGPGACLVLHAPSRGRAAPAHPAGTEPGSTSCGTPH